jgi:acetate kinase
MTPMTAATSPGLGQDMHTILTINAGSSSIKFALFECSDEPAEAADDRLRRLFKGSLERIGLPDARLNVTGDGASSSIQQRVEAADHAAAGAELMRLIESRPESGNLGAVGHRIVHGGPRYSAPQRLDARMIAALRQLSPYDPDHLPQELQLAEAFQRRFPRLPQVACFDTAFHHDLPRVAQLLPLPRRYADQGLRRYGFHGLSYAYLLQQLERLAGVEAAHGRVVFAHLGSGASLAAVHHGQPIDTSMGFTPAAGIPMSTRSGDLDPGLVWYLARTEQLDPQGFNRLVNSESGLLGISATSSDMRDLLQREVDDVRAREAVDLFCYQTRKWIGAFAAALGGLDTLVFAGGIGERAAAVRTRICDGLEFLGVSLDSDRNDRHASLISTDAGRVAVRVIPTDEEQMMAQLVRAALWSKPPTARGSAL